MLSPTPSGNLLCWVFQTMLCIWLKELALCRDPRFACVWLWLHCSCIAILLLTPQFKWMVARNIFALPQMRDKVTWSLELNGLILVVDAFWSVCCCTEYASNRMRVRSSTWSLGSWLLLGTYLHHRQPHFQIGPFEPTAGLGVYCSSAHFAFFGFRPALTSTLQPHPRWTMSCLAWPSASYGSLVN